MKEYCLCGKKLKVLCCWDDDQRTDICFNLSWCEDCGMIYKDTPTSECGKTDLWIPPTLSSLNNLVDTDKWLDNFKNGTPPLTK